MKTISEKEKLVLDHFGLEGSDLPNLDIDALAKQIEDPTKTAVCNVLDRHGKVVISKGKPVEVGITVENEKQIPKSMRFIKWFC